tara:strand:+ start:905 stop:1009 length:105 start_codon:yes stop_codon:yes gene_type:complete
MIRNYGFYEKENFKLSKRKLSLLSGNFKDFLTVA